MHSSKRWAALLHTCRTLCGPLAGHVGVVLLVSSAAAGRHARRQSLHEAAIVVAFMRARLSAAALRCATHLPLPHAQVRLRRETQHISPQLRCGCISAMRMRINTDQQMQSSASWKIACMPLNVRQDCGAALMRLLHYGCRDWAYAKHLEGPPPAGWRPSGGSWPARPRAPLASWARSRQALSSRHPRPARPRPSPGCPQAHAAWANATVPVAHQSELIILQPRPINIKSSSCDVLDGRH